MVKITKMVKKTKTICKNYSPFARRKEKLIHEKMAVRLKDKEMET